MLRRLGVLLVSLAPAAHAGAQGLPIEHGGIGCVVAGQFPRIDASVKETAQVAKARTFFHADDDKRWYYVDMKLEGAVFQGALPKPLKTTRRIHYYVEVTDKAANQNRTPEYAPEVVEDASACSKKGVVAAAAVASKVVVGAPAGASAVPAGFAANTVVAAGGGLGATALVVGAVAVAGGGAVAVAAQVGKEKGEGPSSNPSPASFVFVEGIVYSDPCCPAGPIAPGPRSARRIQGAVVSTSLDSATTTTDAQGFFRLTTQTRCPGNPTFRVTIVAPGCDTMNETRNWGCDAGGQTLNLICR